MNWLIYVVLFIYSAIPIWIFYNSFQALDKKVRINRIKHAIPALLLTIINLSALCYYFYYGNIPYIKFENYTFLIPAFILLLVIIIWNKGRKKEKFIQMDITSKEIEKIRFTKGSRNRQNISISISNIDEGEML